VGENWMQKMLSLMQRPGISHLKLSKMNFLGMGPWMIGKLSKQYHVASPPELLEAAQALGVRFVPCQMTMDMFGLRPEDMIDGLEEPAGAATVIELMTAPGTASLFI
jgi:peroxiredoxin family protein